MAKLRMTLVIEYTSGANEEEDQNAYGTTDPAEMAAIDAENGPAILVESLLQWGDSDDVVQFTVEPVPDNG